MNLLIVRLIYKIIWNIRPENRKFALNIIF